MFLVALMITKWFIFKLSNRHWFGDICKDLLQKSSLNFFDIFIMILSYIIVCLNLATVITITVFYKFEKLNTRPTKKEFKKKLLDKDLLNTILEIFFTWISKDTSNFQVVFFDMQNPVIFGSRTLYLMKSFLKKA